MRKSLEGHAKEFGLNSGNDLDRGKVFEQVSDIIRFDS